MSFVSEKERRQQAIFELISERAISTQGELVEALTQSGFEVTQATVSREMRRLGLVKTPLAGGGYRYSAPSQAVGANKRLSSSTFVKGFSHVEAFCCLNTVAGRAIGIALAIDELELSEIAGTLAGDDVVLVMLRHIKDRARVESILRDLF